jgi:adenine/guanine/hypoxanthine permease
MLERLFELEARGTTPAREARGAVATFLTMAYILVANPQILAAAGVPLESGVTATALAAAFCSILMGLCANMPIALAPGMGLNAVIAFQLAPALGSWQAAMGLVVVEGLLVLLLVVAGLRETVMRAIPIDMRRAIGVGIGLFIAFIGVVNARLVIVPAGTLTALARDPGAVLPPVGFGSLRSPDTAIAAFGLILIAILLARRWTGALIVGMLVCAALAWGLGLTQLPPGPLLRLPALDTVWKADLQAALTLSAAPLVLSLMMVDFFDTIGTATAIAEEAGLHRPDGDIPRLKALLAVDAVSASIGGLLGASSVTSYVESAAGVSEGARTGLHSVVVGVLFALAMFAAPILAMVPAFATAPALIAVGFLMCIPIARVDFRKLDTALPAFLTILLIPLTYSIAHGIGYGLIVFVALQMAIGRGRDVHPVMYGVAAVFAGYFLLE